MRKLLLVVSSVACLSACLWGLGGCSSSSTEAPPPEEEVSKVLLSVSVTGIGAGKVASSVGMDCRKSAGPCEVEVEEGTSVTLSAVPDEGFVFLGWYDGACAGVSDCTLVLSEAKTVKAAFAPVLFVSNAALDGSDALNGNGVQNIFFMKTDGTDLEPVTVATEGAINTGAFSPRWSPDGEKIVFVAKGLERIHDVGTSFNVWIADFSNGFGSSLRNLTGFTVANSLSAAWSPDGSRIAFVSDRRVDGSDALNDNDTRNLWIMNADGSDPNPLTATTADFTDVRNFLWSPQGDKIYFESARDLDLSDNSTVHFTENFWTINPDGTDLRSITQLTTDHLTNFMHDVSPDGGTLLCESSRHIDGSDQENVNGINNIWVIGTDGSSPRALTQYQASGVFAVGPPAFSSDASKIFYTTNGVLDGSDAPLPQQTRNIWSVNSDGTGAKPLSQLLVDPAFQTSLSPLADDSRLFFSSSRNLSGDDVSGIFPTNVWSMNEDGTDLKSLTKLTTPGIDQRPVVVSR